MGWRGPPLSAALFDSSGAERTRGRASFSRHIFLNGGAERGLAPLGSPHQRPKGLWTPRLGTRRLGQEWCRNPPLCTERGAPAQNAFHAQHQKSAFQRILSFGGLFWRGSAPPYFPPNGRCKPRCRRNLGLPRAGLVWRLRAIQSETRNPTEFGFIIVAAPLPAAPPAAPPPSPHPARHGPA